MLRDELTYHHLSDLRLVPQSRADSALALDRRTTVEGWDLDTVRDSDAIAQAAWLALAIARGELAPLGHPHFGSRLHLLIGEEMNSNNIARARAYIREALRDDPRFELLSVEIARARSDPGALFVKLHLAPDIEFGFPLSELIESRFNLEGVSA